MIANPVLRWLSHVWDDITVYLLTLGGMLLAFYQPVFEIGYKGKLSMDPVQMLWGAGMAVMITLFTELYSPGVSPATAKEGKRKRLLGRFLFAAAGGYAWPSITGKLIALIGG